MLKHPRLIMQEMWRTYCHQIHCDGGAEPTEKERLAFWVGVGSVVAAMSPVADQRPASLDDIRDDIRHFHANRGAAADA